jgi:GTPase SAR1 family protein
MNFNDPVMTSVSINIAICGSISVGKSTLLNAICGKRYSDMEPVKVTMIPHIYTDSLDKICDSHEVTITNEEHNIISDKKDYYKPIYHNIDKITELYTENTTNSNIKFHICDLPGFLNPNSKKTSLNPFNNTKNESNIGSDTDIHYKWFLNNIFNYNIIIFVSDITKGLNTPGEIKILENIIKTISTNKPEQKVLGPIIICLLNKCDEIYFDNNQNDLVFGDTQQENIYVNANNILKTICNKYEVDVSPFIPISADNSFIYRMLSEGRLDELGQNYQTKLFKNEFGLSKRKKMTDEEKVTMMQNPISNYEKSNMYVDITNTGYYHVLQIIKNTIDNNMHNFIKNNLLNTFKHLACKKIDDISSYIKSIDQIDKLHQQIITLHHKNVSFYDYFWKNIKYSVINYVNNVMVSNFRFPGIGTTLERYSVDKLQNKYINLIKLLNHASFIPSYPNEFFKQQENRLMTKICNIYDDIILLNESTYVTPANLQNYLQFIIQYNDSQFVNYSEKFLNIICDEGMTYSEEIKKDIIKLLFFINNNRRNHSLDSPKTCEDKSQMNNILRNSIYKILINIQHKCNLNADSFGYFIDMKYYVKKFIKEIGTGDILLCLLFETINKNISIYLGIDGIINLCKQELDYKKITNLIENNLSCERSDIRFEKELLSLANNLYNSYK